MKRIATAVAEYHSKTGAYPTSLGELVGKREGLAVGPRTAPVDPWGTPYKIETVDGSTRIVSAGPDTIKGTEDDTYWIVEPYPAPYPEPRTVQER